MKIRWEKVLGWIAVIILGLVILGQLYTGFRSRPPYAPKVRQKAQFHSIDATLALFSLENGGYPPSDANDPVGTPYCGAMKLAEALIGWDLLGFHGDSVFRADGCDEQGRLLYDRSTLKTRISGPLLPLEQANAHPLSDIYPAGATAALPEDVYVLCDVYEKERPGGKKTGMPVLYYKADPNGTLHDANDPDNPANIYDYRDNQALLELGGPGEPGQKHPLADPKFFYEFTRTHRVSQPATPYRKDTYILISAGFDGLYGTDDDIMNFDRRIRRNAP